MSGRRALLSVQRRGPTLTASSDPYVPYSANSRLMCLISGAPDCSRAGYRTLRALSHHGVQADLQMSSGRQHDVRRPCTDPCNSRSHRCGAFHNSTSTHQVPHSCLLLTKTSQQTLVQTFSKLLVYYQWACKLSRHARPWKATQKRLVHAAFCVAFFCPVSFSAFSYCRTLSQRNTSICAVVVRLSVWAIRVTRAIKSSENRKVRFVAPSFFACAINVSLSACLLAYLIMLAIVLSSDHIVTLFVWQTY